MPNGDGKDFYKHSGGNKTFFPTALKSQILFGIFFAENFCLFFERCGCIRHKQMHSLLLLFTASKSVCDKRYLAETSSFGLDATVQRGSRGSWLNKPEIALQDSGVIPTAIHHQRMLHPKNFPSLLRHCIPCGTHPLRYVWCVAVSWRLFHRMPPVWREEII